MKKVVLSPSKLSLFKECPRCFWLDVNKGVRRPEGIFSSLPNGMDLVLKRHFDAYRGKGLPPDIKGKLKGRLFEDMDKLRVWRNNFKGLDHEDKASGAILKGALDDLFVTEDGLHVPLDFKTRGFPLKENTHEHYQHQMDIYCFLLERNGLRTGDFACLLFYYPLAAEGIGMFRFECDIVRIKTDKKDGERLFLDAVKVLDGEEPASSGECAWCGWNKN